jgi:hypothetical protein
MNAHSPLEVETDTVLRLAQLAIAYLDDMRVFHERGDWTGVKRSHLVAQQQMAKLNLAWPAADAVATRKMGGEE